MKSIASALLFLVLGGILSAQDEEVTVTNVTVWIRATDKSGKPVTGLQQSDFEIKEDGKQMSPTCFEEVALPAVEVSAETSSEASDKHVVFLFDLANTSQTEFLHLKRKADEFLQQLMSNWSVTIVGLVPGMVHAEVESSRDPAVIQAALDKLQANPTRDIEAVNRRRELSTILRNLETLPRRAKDPKMVSDLCLQAREYALEEKKNSMSWMGALKDFDRYIKKQDAATHQVVLLFSGGVSSNPGKQYFDLIRNSNFMRNFAQDEFDAVRQFQECEDEGGFDLYTDFQQLVGELNRYNVTFYTVSSRGPINDLMETIRESDRKFNIRDLDFLKDFQDFLSVMADETGGLYFGNSLNFKRGFDAIQSDLNHQYLICYKPPAHSKPGHHEIEVKARKSGVRLRHRSGYFD